MNDFINYLKISMTYLEIAKAQELENNETTMNRLKLINKVIDYNLKFKNGNIEFFK